MSGLIRDSSWGRFQSYTTSSRLVFTPITCKGANIAVNGQVRAILSLHSQRTSQECKNMAGLGQGAVAISPSQGRRICRHFSPQLRRLIVAQVRLAAFLSHCECDSKAGLYAEARQSVKPESNGLRRTMPNKLIVVDSLRNRATRRLRKPFERCTDRRSCC